MTDPSQGESAEAPGSVRTWWHPLLVSTLKWTLQNAYEVRDEVSVGRMPLRIDVLLLRRLGEPPEIARRELGPLMPMLNEYTAIEFKSPSDAIEPGDLDQLLGCVHLYRSQQRPPLEQGVLSLVVLAPAITQALRNDANQLGFAFQERGAGVWEVDGGLFPLWVVETDRLAQEGETVLALFSRIFLRDAKPIIERWKATGHTGVLHFILQQIEQFKSLGEEFAMQHKDAELMERTWEELLEAVLAAAPPELRLRGLSAEQRLEGLTVEELDQLQDELKRLRSAEREKYDGSTDGDATNESGPE